MSRKLRYTLQEGYKGLSNVKSACLAAVEHSAIHAFRTNQNSAPYQILYTAAEGNEDKRDSEVVEAVVKY